MDTNDIKRVISSSNIFEGLKVECQEYIPRLPFGTAVIFNTIKCKEGNGNHWVLCCHDINEMAVYYDSFAKQIPDVVYQYFNSKDVYSFTRQTQEKGTYQCGQMCLYAYALLSQGGIATLENLLGSDTVFNTLTAQNFVKILSDFNNNPMVVKKLKETI